MLFYKIQTLAFFFRLHRIFYYTLGLRDTKIPLQNWRSDYKQGLGFLTWMYREQYTLTQYFMLKLVRNAAPSTTLPQT